MTPLREICLAFSFPLFSEFEIVLNFLKCCLFCVYSCFIFMADCEMSNKDELILLGILGGLWNARTSQRSHHITIFHCTYRNCRRLIQALFWKLEWEVQYEKLKLAYQISMAEDSWKQAVVSVVSPGLLITSIKHATHIHCENHKSTLWHQHHPRRFPKNFCRVEINWMFCNDIQWVRSTQKGATVWSWRVQAFPVGNHWSRNFYVLWITPESETQIFMQNSILILKFSYVGWPFDSFGQSFQQIAALTQKQIRLFHVTLYFHTLFGNLHKLRVTEQQSFFLKLGTVQQRGVAKLWVSRGDLG